MILPQEDAESITKIWMPFWIRFLKKNAGFNVSETTIRTHIRQKRDIHKECFIRQEYQYGHRFEYDFGEVKLIIDGKQTKGFLAVLTAPASGFRWAYLYHSSKMEVFLDSQVRFFEMLGGCFEEGVYDNMANVVNKFIGKSEKKLDRNLIRYIEEHINEDLRLDTLSELFFVSKYHISHLFKDKMGISLHQYILKKRLAMSKDALINGRKPSEVFREYGFSDYSVFYRAFVKEFGLSPQNLIRQKNRETE